MTKTEAEEKLRAHVGQSVAVTFGGHTEKVRIISVDPDGFVCQVIVAPEQEVTAAFWIAHEEVTAITEL